MPNTLTDALGMVETFSAQGFWGLSRTYRSESGFSLEVFDGNRHIKSIPPQDAGSGSYGQFGVRSGYTILRIKSGCILELNCQLTTDDKFKRQYEGKVELRVSNATNFATLYRQGRDPVALAKLAIEGELQKYAQRTKHDDFKDTNIRFEIRTALEIASNTAYGLEVVRVQQSLLYPDPHIEQIIENERTAEIQRLKDAHDRQRFSEMARYSREEDARQKEHERQQDAREGDHRRVQDEQQRQHDRRQEALDRMSQALTERIIREIEDGVPLESIIRRYPGMAEEMLSNFLTGGAKERLAPPRTNTFDGDDEIVDGTYRSHPSMPLIEDDTTQPGVAIDDTPFQVKRFGITLILIELSDEQRQAWGIQNTYAFSVCGLKPAGPAATAHMMTSDILIEIDEQPVQNVQTALKLLSLPSASIIVRVVRNGQLLDLRLSDAS